MRTTLLSIALATFSLVSQAQSPPGRSLDLAGDQIGRMAESFDRAVTEGQAWARIKPPLEALYIELRGKGETRQQAIHNLRRIALPGVDVVELGHRAQQVRGDLEQLAQHLRHKDGLNEPASVAATALALHELLQTLIALERPDQIHLAVVEQDGNAKLRRSLPLHDGGKPRTVVEFTEPVGPALSHECTVDTLGLAQETYFTVKCRARGKIPRPVAVAKSECSINSERFKSLRLAIQADESKPETEVLVWCSFLPR